MTSKRPNPNRKPFPRAYLIEPYVTDAKVHPLVREAKEPYYRRKNPKGFRHDLGALDIFLDNFGVLIAEQILPPHVPEEVTKHYLRELMQLLHYRWALLQHQVIQRDPWWGKHFNSAARRANAGEPRGLLRFMGDEDWSRIPFAGISYPHMPLQDPLQQGFFEEELADLFDERGFLWPFEQLTDSSDRGTPGFLYDDWDYDDLIPPDYYKRSLR